MPSRSCSSLLLFMGVAPQKAVDRVGLHVSAVWRIVGVERRGSEPDLLLRLQYHSFHVTVQTGSGDVFSIQNTRDGYTIKESVACIIVQFTSFVPSKYLVEGETRHARLFTSRNTPSKCNTYTHVLRGFSNCGAQASASTLTSPTTARDSAASHADDSVSLPPPDSVPEALGLALGLPNPFQARDILLPRTGVLGIDISLLLEVVLALPVSLFWSLTTMSWVATAATAGLVGVYVLHERKSEQQTDIGVCRVWLELDGMAL